MVVQRDLLDAAFLELREDRADLGFEQHQVTHQHRLRVTHLLERDPGAERKRRLQRHARGGDVEVAARHADLVGPVRLQSPGLAEPRIYLFPIDGRERLLRLLAQQPFAPIDWKQVDAGLGKSGTLQPDGAYKVGVPRGDLHVTAAGVALKPALALGSWVAFKQVSDTQAMLMGDLVLLEAEVGPVLAKLQEGGIEQTALHNHLLHESPHVMYMHIGGHGTPAKLAAAVDAGLALTGTPLGAAPAAPPAASLGIDTAQIGQILGFHGRVNGGVYQVGVPRAETITADGVEVPPSMGLATAINFQPTGSGKAAITGDFVLIGDEVNPVIRALRDSGIAITALHSHLLTDSPHLFFMHYWANDDALKLAHGLRAALDTMNVKKAG